MNINTTHFGGIKVDESKIIEMRGGGILGFEHLRKYMLNVPDDDSPFWWLQSIEDKSVAFFVLNPFITKVDYEPVISDNDTDILEIDDEKDVMLLAIININRETLSVYVNLKAPIVINTKKMTAKQVILEDSSYPVRYNLMNGLRGEDLR